VECFVLSGMGTEQHPSRLVEGCFREFYLYALTWTSPIYSLICLIFSLMGSMPIFCHPVLFHYRMIYVNISTSILLLKLYAKLLQTLWDAVNLTDVLQISKCFVYLALAAWTFCIADTGKTLNAPLCFKY
jgi:hypothetical protein